MIYIAINASMWILLVLLSIGVRGVEFVAPFCSIPQLCEQETAFLLPDSQTVIFPVHGIASADSSCVYSVKTSFVCSSHRDAQFNQLITKWNASTGDALNRPPMEMTVQVYSAGITMPTSFNKRIHKVRWDGPLPPHFLQIGVKNQQFGSLLSRALTIQYHSTPTFAIEVEFHILGVLQTMLPSGFDTFSTTHTEIEPGSWFYTLTPLLQPSAVDANVAVVEQAVRGLPTYGYHEIILSDQDITRERVFHHHPSTESIHPAKFHEDLRQYFTARGWHTTPPQAFPVDAALQPVIPVPAPDQPRICISGGTRMDGQKRIWLDQMRYFLLQQAPPRFQFVYLFALDVPKEMEDLGNREHITLTHHDQLLNYSFHSADSMLHYLSQLPNLLLAEKPLFELQPDEFDQRPRDGSPSAADLWQGNVTKIYEYLHARYLHAQGRIEAIDPPWCRHFYLKIARFIQSFHCDLLIFGNAREFTADVFLTDTSAALQIPTVVELLNLFLPVEGLADVIVAPSHYAANHYSVQGPRETSRTTRGFAPINAVIPPAVDFQHFSPERIVESPEALRHQLYPKSFVCEASSMPCVYIGFVGRVSAEKSPGLFLQMAYHLVETYHLPWVRFVVLGDGPLLESLRDLTRRLNLMAIVHFEKWVPHEALPTYLRTLDMVINPSLRAWSETFCIANVEVMAMEIPLVTFGVGGIGDYVAAPASPSAEANSSAAPWTLTSNALLLNNADPRHMAAAVYETFLLHPAQAKRTGKEGRRSILHYFTYERQMTQYQHLYESVIAAKRSVKARRLPESEKEV